MTPRGAPKHINWLSDTGKTIFTSDGVNVPVIDFQHQADDSVLSEWAKYFREHYCNDADLDALRNGTGKTRGEYLQDVKFPSEDHAGPSIRSGDFAEILVADYIEFLLNFWVPRTRYDRKFRNESKRGVDVIGFRYRQNGQESTDDVLITCEVKAALQSENENTLKSAIEGAKKDYDRRKAESLNAIKQRLIDRGENNLVPMISRFQNKADHPYKEISGAAAVHSHETWRKEVVTAVNTSSLLVDQLFLLIIKGPQLMQLANALYERACNEA